MEDVYLSVIINCPSDDVSQLIEIKKELYSKQNGHSEFFNPAVGKRESSGLQLLDYQIKSEAPDIKFGINGGNDDIYIKVEQLVNDEVHIKDEIDPSPTDETKEMFTNDLYFECDICNSKFASKRKVQQHLYNHTKAKPFRRNIADYKYSIQNGTRRRMNKHKGRALFNCVICGYGCVQKGNLQQHMRTHTGERPFKCSECDYRCIQKSHLQQHMRTHTGEKPFKCSVCDYRCIQKSHLQQHTRRHTGEKPFKCDVCDYRCVQKSHLQGHMKTHT